MLENQFSFNWLAIIAAVLMAFIFGSVWYGPLFGKLWAKEMGFKKGKITFKKMIPSLSLQLVQTFLTTYVLAHMVRFWLQLIHASNQEDFLCYNGLIIGFLTWVGFYVPMQLGKVAWEQKSWKLFSINIGQDFFTLQIICQILTQFR